ncbi:MAG: YfiR family protein [Deltaproteobacteria bacterium]|nr:MAG: YfiR family protein [Deltaproteobacteria bacterium]
MSRHLPGPSRRQLLAGLLATACAPAAWALSVDAAELKAVFLMRFLRYVDFGEAVERATVRVIGAPDIAAALEAVGTRLGSLEVYGTPWPEPGEALVLAPCDVVYVRGTLDQVGSLELPANVLVVGDDAALMPAGTALAFYWEDDKLRFEASQEHAEARGVRLGAEILRLAREAKR